MKDFELMRNPGIPLPYLQHESDLEWQIKSRIHQYRMTLNEYMHGDRKGNWADIVRRLNRCTAKANALRQKNWFWRELDHN